MAFGSVNPARPRRTESSAGGHLPCRSGALPAPRGDPSLLPQPLGAGIVRPAGSGLKRGRRGGSEAGSDPSPPRFKSRPERRLPGCGWQRGRARLGLSLGGLGPSRSDAQSLAAADIPASEPSRLLPAGPAIRSPGPAGCAPLGRRGPGGPEPCPSGGPTRCGSGRPGRAGGAEGPRGLRTRRPAAGRRLPLGGTGPGPRHPSSTPFRRRSFAFLRQRRFGLSRAAFLAHGRVKHLQDEGRATYGWKDARERGGELAGNGTKTNQGRKKNTAAHLRRGGEGSP